jgi:hypothetical protein
MPAILAGGLHGLGTFGTMTADPRQTLAGFLASEAAGLCHVDYWRAVARLWRGADRAERDAAQWPAMWRRASIAPGARLSLMRDDEREAWSTLPPEVTVHRGFAGHDWRGLDWTGDRSSAAAQARGAAARSGGSSPRLATARIPRDRVIALWGPGLAGDLIVLPDDLAPEVVELQAGA